MILRKYKLENGNETSSVFSVWRLDYEKVMSLCSKFQIAAAHQNWTRETKIKCDSENNLFRTRSSTEFSPVFDPELKKFCRTKKANLCQTLTRNFFNVYASVVQRLRIVLVSDTILTQPPPPHTCTQIYTNSLTQGLMEIFLIFTQLLCSLK